MGPSLVKSLDVVRPLSLYRDTGIVYNGTDMIYTPADHTIQLGVRPIYILDLQDFSVFFFGSGYDRTECEWVGIESDRERLHFEKRLGQKKVERKCRKKYKLPMEPLGRKY